MRLVHHRVEGQHDAWDLRHPCLGGRAFKQESPEHVIHGPVATLVGGIRLRMVRRGQHTLDPQRAHQFPPDFTHEFATTVGQEAVRSAEIWDDMPEEGVTHRVCSVIASQDKDSVPGVAIDKHDEKLMSVIGG